MCVWCVFEIHTRNVDNKNLVIDFYLNIVPGGGFEPPKRGFSAAMALYYLMITVGFMLINLVCVKVCF